MLISGASGYLIAAYSIQARMKQAMHMLALGGMLPTVGALGCLEAVGCAVGSCRNHFECQAIKYPGLRRSLAVSDVDYYCDIVHAPLCCRRD